MTPLSGATLDAYVARVGSAIDATSDSVVLVGHSMAGMVITSVAEQNPDKISKLVYVAAFVPKDGDTLQALATSDEGSHLVQALTIDEENGVGKLPCWKRSRVVNAHLSPTRSHRLGRGAWRQLRSPIGSDD